MVLKMRVSEIRVKRIRVNQGLGVFQSEKYPGKNTSLKVKFSLLKVKFEKKNIKQK